MENLNCAPSYDINIWGLLLVLIFLFFAIGLALEMICHKNITLEQAARLFKKHLVDIYKGLFKEEQSRHEFDGQLAEDFRKVVSPYHNRAFDINVNRGMLNEVPYILVHFVPSTVLTKDEEIELAELVLLKFREYLYAWELPWENFSLFQGGTNYGKILIFYSELPEDAAHYKKRYLVFQRANEPKSSKPLIDDNLENELNDED